MPAKLPWVGREGERAGVSRGADTKANALGAGGALELLEHAILLDAACDDDGRRDAEPLAGEVDLLRRFRALELVDLKSVTINTAKGEVCGVSAGADKSQTLWSWFECRAAYFSDCNVVLPLSPSAIAAAPSGPSRLSTRLQRGGGGR